ncbi:hypothetical protein BDY24DRAFT_375610 [Mrakia frigida]|uniref:Lsb5p n=1 Tax=Mrakia frigida TaxID=29902 RepID=UPI003FCC2024
MSSAGNTIKTGIKLFSVLTSDKPHSSVTDWIEILTGDNYAENELDGVAELVQAVDIQGTGPDEASRAIRKKIKYGSTHKQIRSLTLLKSLSENSSTFHKSFTSSPQLVDRLKETARDSHTDPRVKQKIIMVCLGWKKQDEDGDKGFSRVAGIYGELHGHGHARKPSMQASSGTGHSSVSSSTPAAAPALRDGGLWDHSWDVSPAAAAANKHATKEQESAAKLDALSRKAAQASAQEEKDRKDRERREIERRERDLAEREQKLKDKEARKSMSSSAPPKPKPGAKPTGPKRPPFNFEKEKPVILQTVASASQSANNLINAIRLVNRERESITENLRVLKYLEEAKASRKKIIRYIQMVEDEDYIGTLLQTNETIITSLQLYDKLSKPFNEDSDDEAPPAKTEEEEEISRSLAAARLQKERESELAKLQAKQKAAVEKEMARRKAWEEEQRNVHPDLAGLEGLNFGGGASAPSPARAPPARIPSPPSVDSLSDDGSYDSSDDDYQLRARSRRPSTNAPAPQQYDAYGSLGDGGGAGLLDTPTGEADPFADDFFAGPDTPAATERKEWTSI